MFEFELLLNFFAALFRRKITFSNLLLLETMSFLYIMIFKDRPLILFCVFDLFESKKTHLKTWDKKDSRRWEDRTVR